ncbi:MAG: phosphate ABC transporter permease subunit PstC [bacterium]|nr:phosphate ABC transporter permease subunit PstC [bacterium]
MNARKFKDLLARKIMGLLAGLVLSLVFLIIFGLYNRSKPILVINSLKDLLFSTSWHPTQGKFGLLNFIFGTFWITSIALLITVPLSILTGIYIAEYAPRRVREFIKPLIDLLAGISPVIYGVWGVVVIVPLVRDYLMPFLSGKLPFFPFVSENYTGYSALSGGIVLAVMVFPIIISIVEEIIRTVPLEMREASLSLGATKWETVKYVVLKRVRPGIIAAIILGMSRAVGETIAVLMVAGCSMQGFPRSIFDTAYPLPAFIANTYGEMMSIPLYDSAVLLAAFLLLLMTIFFNMIGWGILLKLEE